MNMTYARSKFRLSPKERAKLLPLSTLSLPGLGYFSRKMVVAASASTLPAPKKDPGCRARRHRLNPSRRSREARKAARPAEALKQIADAIASIRY